MHFYFWLRFYFPYLVLFVGNLGMGYGPLHAMDGYGYGFHGSPLPVCNFVIVHLRPRAIIFCYWWK